MGSKAGSHHGNPLCNHPESLEFSESPKIRDGAEEVVLHPDCQSWINLDNSYPLSGTWYIKALSPGDKLLDSVVELWKPERKRLGLFPRGAFEDYAHKGGIHIALDAQGTACGYIATRVSNGWIHIAHLCVAPPNRRSTVARTLVEHVAQIATQFQHLGIRLKCRRDYEASAFWPKVGFHAGSITSGKAMNSQLILWIRRNQLVGDLFSLPQGDQPRRTAVLDANVFYDLDNENQDWDLLPVHVQESLYLAADWVSDAIELGIVDEIFTEIHRHACPEENARQQLRADNLPLVLYQDSEVDGNIRKLEEILGWKNAPREQPRSDMRQIAKSAASSAEFFVTRDRTLLDASATISKAMAIRVVNPATLLSTLDEEERGHLYVPAKIQGTAIRESVPRQDDLDRHAEKFLGRNPQEALHHFRQLSRKLGASCSGNTGGRMKLISDANQSPILLQSTQTDAAEVLKLPLLRTAVHPLASTVVRHFLLQAIQTAATTGKTAVVAHDPFLSPVSESALSDLGFIKGNGCWRKLLCPRILSASNPDEWPDTVIRPDEADTDGMADLERSYWPLKLRDAGINSVSITIKAHWAAKLFEGSLAGEELFPVDPAKVFNCENVFYRSPRAWPKSLPKRILWYVSGTKSYRGCSRILDVQVGAASSVFKRYERLGIYEWRDLMTLTKGKRHGEVMAIHFADTEVFDRPVTLSEARKFNEAKILVGAHRISEKSFFEIYLSGLARFDHHEQGPSPVH